MELMMEGYQQWLSVREYNVGSRPSEDSTGLITKKWKLKYLELYKLKVC
jgi:hypothetical protein